MKFGEYLFSRNEQYEEMMTEGVNNTIVYERPKEEIDEVMRSLWEIAQWIAIELWNIMRALHSGSASAFQADSAGSIPAARSITSLRCNKLDIH